MIKKITAFLKLQRTSKRPLTKLKAHGQEECSLIFGMVRINLKNPSWKTVLLSVVFMALIATIIYWLTHTP